MLQIMQSSIDTFIEETEPIVKTINANLPEFNAATARSITQALSSPDPTTTLNDAITKHPLFAALTISLSSPTDTLTKFFTSNADLLASLTPPSQTTPSLGSLFLALKPVATIVAHLETASSVLNVADAAADDGVRAAESLANAIGNLLKKLKNPSSKAHDSPRAPAATDGTIAATLAATSDSCDRDLAQFKLAHNTIQTEAKTLIAHASDILSLLSLAPTSFAFSDATKDGLSAVLKETKNAVNSVTAELKDVAVTQLTDMTDAITKNLAPAFLAIPPDFLSSIATATSATFSAERAKRQQQKCREVALLNVLRITADPEIPDDVREASKRLVLVLVHPLPPFVHTVFLFQPKARSRRGRSSSSIRRYPGSLR